MHIHFDVTNSPKIDSLMELNKLANLIEKRIHDGTQQTHQFN